MDCLPIVQSWNVAVAGLLVAAQQSPEESRRMRQLAAELQLLASRFEGADILVENR